ncbi:hypothetical protein GJ698_02275 [Pseudoduganella sp. FT26W]|uniref:Uncharacterized protein n=1 Tax=Duganella aquatilis TaxID=2666082 RepID=A0A844D453_9BURK|nr:hypothetical protein [Duganella aquatilis]MRW82916.1 hypothetical protein [Duganella aquatilis]
MKLNNSSNNIYNIIQRRDMPHIIQETYRGWEITIRCSHIASKIHPARYTAIAEAELQPGENPGDWVDPRMQVLSTGGRSFATGDACINALLGEAKQLIDALRR